MYVLIATIPSALLNDCKQNAKLYENQEKYCVLHAQVINLTQEHKAWTITVYGWQPS
jgi:hypothetical protein